MAVRFPNFRPCRALLPPPPHEEFWYSFLLEAVNPRNTLRLEGLGKLRKFDDLIRNRTNDLQACNTAPQPTTLPRATYVVLHGTIIQKRTF
jgi:hypothetical protein